MEWRAFLAKPGRIQGNAFWRINGSGSRHEKHESFKIIRVRVFLGVLKTYYFNFIKCLLHDLTVYCCYMENMVQF